MKILQLCNKLPYPEKDGGAIAINTLTHALIDSGCKVKMLAMNTKKHFTDINSIPQQFRTATDLETVTIDTTVKAHKALLPLLTGKSYNISRFYSIEFKNKLVSILKAEKFDIIQLEGLYLTPYIASIRKFSNAPIILRAHNVEWMIWDRLAKEESNVLKKPYLSRLAKQLRAYETKIINLCDGITVFIKNDKQQFAEMGCRIPIEIFPFGISLSKYTPATPAKPTSLFYIGSLDWMPNLQGLEWFLQHVWNKVHSTNPSVEFHVAGRNMPAHLNNASYPGVSFHGEIENAIHFMQENGIMLVPLFAGGGIRIKIIEGMALQKPIISSSIGIEGIDCSPGQDVMIANTSREFFNSIKECLDNAGMAHKIGINGRRYAERAYDINTITGNLLEFYKAMISKKTAVH